MALTTTIPHEEYKNLVRDSVNKENTINILSNKDLDEKSQITALKAILNIEPSEEPTEEEEGEENGEKTE